MAVSSLIVTSQTQPIYLHHSICLALVRVKLDKIQIKFEFGMFLKVNKRDVLPKTLEVISD